MISMPAASASANFAFFEASLARMAIRENDGFWRMNSCTSGMPMAPPAPMRRIERAIAIDFEAIFDLLGALDDDFQLSEGLDEDIQM